jgi:hypothetical protein
VGHNHLSDKSSHLVGFAPLGAQPAAHPADVTRRSGHLHPPFAMANHPLEKQAIFQIRGLLTYRRGRGGLTPSIINIL